MQSAIGQDPPLLGGNPIVGSALDLQRSQISTYERAMLEEGDVVRLVVGPPGLRFDMYCVFHPDGVQHVLAGANDNYTKQNPFYLEIGAAIGNGLLTTEGEVWRRQKRLIQPLFTRARIATYADLMVEEAAAAVERWRANNATSTTVDLHSEMTRLTLRVVGRALFGDDVDEAVDTLRWAFPIANEHVFRRAMSPVKLPANAPTPGNKRAARAREALYDVVDRLIARRRSNGHSGNDLLSLLLQARDPETGESMDEQEVRDEALVFLLAGHETTSTALTFTLWLLGRHHDEQKRVLDEIDAVIGDRLPTFDDVGGLSRIAMAIKEAMRLYPPAYATGRQNQAEDEIGGYRIPQGSIVVISQWATHRHPKFWDEPEKFDPERFTPEREKARHRYAHFPFGGGPRVCIGSHFSMLEAVLAVAVIGQACELNATTDQVPLNTAGITLRPKDAVPVEVSFRRPAVTNGTDSVPTVSYGEGERAQ